MGGGSLLTALLTHFVSYVNDFVCLPLLSSSLLHCPDNSVDKLATLLSHTHTHRDTNTGTRVRLTHVDAARVGTDF